MIERQVNVTLQADTGDAVRALARLSDSLKTVSEQLGRAFGRATRGFRALFDAVGSTTFDDRVYARRANRAALRSLRNQPPVVWPTTWDEAPPRRLASASRKRRPHGRPR